MVAGRGRVPVRAAEARDHQQIAALGEQQPHDLAPAQRKMLAGGSGHGAPQRPKLLAPIRRWASRTASGTWASKAMLPAGVHGVVGGVGLAQALGQHAGDLERGLGALAHRQLPGIELAPFAAHRHQHQQRQAAGLVQRQHVDAVADAARLHQQRAALAAEPGAGEQRDRLPPRSSAPRSSSPDRPGRARSGARGRHPARRPPGAPPARPARRRSHRASSTSACSCSPVSPPEVWPAPPHSTRRLERPLRLIEAAPRIPACARARCAGPDARRPPWQAGRRRARSPRWPASTH